MATFVVIGAQWGDEGKGKMTDYLAEDANVVVRFQGGNNAGHTVVVGDKEYKLHLIPSGILYEDKLNVLGNGVVIDPKDMLKEINYLKELGVKITSKTLLISDRAHVIMPYHKALDGAIESFRGNKSIGTTGKGIGPCYTDKAERTGIRICDLMNPEVFKEKLTLNLEIKNAILTKIYNKEPFKFDDIYNEYLDFANQLREFVCDTSVRVYDEIKNNKNILFEGAQGNLLDIDYGTYPYVTSSNTTATGVAAGVGIGPNMVESVVGIAKAYTTRVGEGPFPTELNNDLGEYIREKGHEYGVTTGRSRRCGWLDAVILKQAVRVSGITSFAVTKIDTIAGMEKLNICVGYKIGDKIIDYIPASLEDLAKCEPIYEEFDGWDESVSIARSFDELHPNAKIYLKRIEEITGARVSIVSVGPKRDQTMRFGTL